tara:strand:+ start:1134 stop:2000 length:867 start_codon:yes stop_codon:yes gene_type:complete
MSILVHKAGINKTLSQKSDYLEGTSTVPRTDSDGWRDSLVGEFLAGSGLSGSGGDIWGNSISGQNDLRVFNGLVLNSSSVPYHASFDGTNDYIWNTSTGYGGNPFTVDLSMDFTIGFWVRTNFLHGFYNATVCVQNSSGGFLASEILNDGRWNVRASGATTGPGGATGGATTKLSFSLSSDTWHYLSISHARFPTLAYVYIDGIFHAHFRPSYASGDWDSGGKNLGFGHDILGNSGNIASNSALEVAKIYVWNRYWGASQHRHMFLGQAAGAGIHDLNPHFGPTRTTT